MASILSVPPTDDREAAIVAELQPGNYTAIALVEVYDLNPAATAKLANISTRGFIGAGDTMIGGLIPLHQSCPAVLNAGEGQHIVSPDRF